MNTFASARVVVVASDESGRSLAQSLTRMGVAGVTVVPNPDEARLLCDAERADMCLVVLQRPVPDEVPGWTAETEAPGHKSGVPSLLMADVVTPHILKGARQSGYIATVETQLPARLLYRSLRALLQSHRRHGDADARIAGDAAASAAALQAPDADGWFGGKLKLQ
jgi:DNA-binding NtrC family response regulator